MAYRLQTRLLKTGIGDRIRQRNGGHKGHRINQHDPEHQAGLIHLRGVTECGGTDEVANDVGAVCP